jgi:hypothetical protein
LIVCPHDDFAVQQTTAPWSTIEKVVASIVATPLTRRRTISARCHTSRQARKIKLDEPHLLDRYGLPERPAAEGSKFSGVVARCLRLCVSYRLWPFADQCGKRMTAFHRTEVPQLALGNGRNGASVRVPAAEAECPLSVQSGDLHQVVRQRARCAESGRSPGRGSNDGRCGGVVPSPSAPLI